MRWVASLVFLSVGLMAQTDSRSWLNDGVGAFKNARYPEAVASFQKAVEADPSSVPAHLYLGTAYMQQYIPGAESKENLEMNKLAKENFLKVLEQSPGDKIAVAVDAGVNQPRHRPLSQHHVV